MVGNFLTAVAAPAITAEMLQPLTDGVFSNVGVILPIGISIFGVLTAISLVPKIVRKFLK